jgi:hypothetical protein
MNKNIGSSLVDSFSKDRFLYLLISIFLLIALAPLLQGFVGIQILMDIFLTSILISGIFAISDKKRHTITASLLALPMLISIWASRFLEIPLLDLTKNLFGILFFAYTIIISLFFILKEREITRDVISGAIVVYLLIGVMWAFIFSILELLEPGSFSIAEGPIRESRSIFFYYSFVTLTTLGYGDITPLTDPARSFSLLEAVIGQIYITVLIALLVGKYISQSMEKNSR